MPYEFYKFLHISAVILVFFAMGGAAWVQWSHGGQKQYPGRKAVFITHGVGLFLILLGGFGLLARTQFPMTSTWVMSKLVIWLVLGGLIAAIHRKPDKIKILLPITAILGIVAVFLAVYKIS